jgi:hypothetical protein
VIESALLHRVFNRRFKREVSVRLLTPPKIVNFGSWPSDRDSEMPRKYAVLKQFTIDLDRLLTEAEEAYAELRTTKTPTQAQILKLFRPIHSLKGICSMVEEAKLLVRAFHMLEDALPPLLPVQHAKGPVLDYVSVADATFRMAREAEQILLRKIELWKEFGADQNESRGLIVDFREGSDSVSVWVPITGLLGLATADELKQTGITADLFGTASPNGEVLLVETMDGSVALQFDDIRATCTRLEAVQTGVPHSFKEWWQSRRKSRTSTAA